MTEEAVLDILTEISDLRGERPVTKKELDYAKAFLTRRFPGRFETASGILAQLAQIVIYQLPWDYYSTYQATIEAVTLDAVHQAAVEHLSPRHLKLAVVGDPAHTAT